MSDVLRQREDSQSSQDLSPFARFTSSFDELLRAFEYAGATQTDLWQFAVEIGVLRELDVSRADLRWLVKREYLQHRREVRSDQPGDREFIPSGTLSFSDETCFVLTTRGAALARQLLNGDSRCPGGRPRWDSDERTLFVDNHVVKRFLHSAPNQVVVIEAFEEEGWPSRIYDPLPQQPGLDPKRRLHDTIKWLNRNQHARKIRFRGDGSGEGVMWEFVSPPE